MCDYRSDRATLIGRPIPSANGISVAMILVILLLRVTGCDKPDTADVPAGAADRPNIVFLMVDTLRADRLRAYGSRDNLTPTMDAIADEGVTFDRAIAAAPWTQPSIASLFCSYYPGVHKVRSYELALDSSAQGSAPSVSVFSDAFTTLAEALRQGGYETAAFCANPFVVPGFGYAQGFDHFDASFAENRTPGSIVNEAALAWLAGRDASKPLFLYLHYMDVHGPYEGDPSFLDALLDEVERAPAKHELSTKETNVLGYLNQMPATARDIPRHRRLMRYREYWEARYDAGVRAMDSHLAALRERLTELGLWQTAYVVLTADHGEALCEHGFWSHGYSVNHNQLHVPLILRWPDRLPAGKRVGATVRLIDIMPTLLDQLRLPPVEGVQGTSLLPQVMGKPPSKPLVAFAECVKIGTEQKALYYENLKLLVLDAQPPRLALYDVASDPDEQRLLPKPTDRLGKLAELLRRQLGQNAALATSVGDTQTPLSAAQRQRLESLGYLGASPTTSTSQPSADAEP